MAGPTPGPPPPPPKRPPKRVPRRPSRAAPPAPPAAGPVGDFLMRLAATKSPPPGSGLLALAAWSAWVAHLVRPALRDWIYGAAGLFVVFAISYNRAHAMGKEKLEREERKAREEAERDEKGTRKG
jgi:hypothetical protein